MVLEKLDINVQNNEVGFLAYVKINSKWIKDLNIRPKPIKLLIENTKINSKWIKDLNERPDTIKLSEENIGRTLYDINHSKVLFDPPPREMVRKTKINKWDLMKLKRFCTAKETINKMKDNPQNGRKYLQTNQRTKD